MSLSAARKPESGTGPFRTRQKPAVLLMLAMTLWVVLEAVGSVASREIPLVQLVWLRYGFHLLLMLAVLGPATGLSYVRTRRPVLQIFRSLLMVAMPVGFILGMRTLPPEQVVAMLWLSPLLVVGFAPIIGEWPSRRMMAAVLAGSLGAFGIYRQADWTLAWATVYPLMMAASFALYIVLTRVLDRTEGVLTNLFYSAAGVFVALAPVMPLVWSPPSPIALAACAVVGVAGWLVLWALDLALRSWPAPRAAPLLFFQVVVLQVAEAAAGEGWTKSAGLGLALIFAGMYLVMRRERPALSTC